MGVYRYDQDPKKRRKFVKKWRRIMAEIKKDPSKRKLYPFGAERGKWIQIVANMKPGESKIVSVDEVARARWSMGLLWGAGSMVTRKIKGSDDYRIWRLF